MYSRHSTHTDMPGLLSDESNSEEVKPTTAGAFAFATRENSAAGTCATDILLAPEHVPTDTVCFTAG
jgi:hypothetical protein